MTHDGWLNVERPPHIDLSRPGIYPWSIDCGPSHVGKATSLDGRLGEYRSDVRKTAGGRPHSEGSPHGFRRIHRRLAEARTVGGRAAFSVIGPCDRGEPPLARERRGIAALRPPRNRPSQLTPGGRA